MAEPVQMYLDSYPFGFEQDDCLRSAFIRDLTLQQIDCGVALSPGNTKQSSLIPKTLIRYWHDPHDVPNDVCVCLNTWERLSEEGFEIRVFNDISAAAYIADRFGARECEAFARCRHPAMRSDYLRMCALLAEGGLYVDADDVLLGDGWKSIFHNGTLKVQPLCYDTPTNGMVPTEEIWRRDLPTIGRIFYVNNNPLASPANHPLLLRALTCATEKLVGEIRFPEIQSTTGPGNLTATLAAHARDLLLAGAPLDFELLRGWDEIAETRWDLSYRKDARNWRNMVNS